MSINTGLNQRRIAMGICALGILISVGSGLPAAMAWTAFVTVACAGLWMTEALPLPVTALIPIAVFPLVGVLTPAEVAQAYGNPIILLFLGGFLLSRAMESSGAHRRLALEMVHVVGGTGHRLLFAFMLASAVLSMWVSNTATVLMLLPVAMAVVDAMQDKRMATALLLAVAYGASIGGLGTPIGSPPNLIFLQVYHEQTGEVISFVEWMSLGLPVVICLLPLAGLWLARNLQATNAVGLPSRGVWTSWEKRVLLVFALTALGWITRTDPWGGWAAWLHLPQANDASVALLGALVLFALPNGQGGPLLSWESAVKIPWGMLILFAGGIAIAKAFSASGLSTVIGDELAAVSALPLVLTITVISLSVTFLTEINSNTATAVLLLPLLASAALAGGQNPLLYMLPATFSASCAFMLPVATPPNAIVFGSGKVTVQEMMREGVVLNLLGVVVITALCALRFS